MEIKININDSVMVKLTDEGVAEFEKAKYSLPTPDDEGYYEITLWKFTNVLGGITRMGKKLPFDGNLIFRA